MKIAYVVPYVPNLIRTRPYNLIMQLVSLGHEVEVFTLGSGSQDLLDVQALISKCSNVEYHVQPVWHSFLNSAVAVFSERPLQSVYSWQGDMARKLVKQVSRKEFDIVHVEHLRGSRYGIYLKESFPTMPIVWDSVDCISHLFKQASAQSTSLFSKLIARFELDRTRKLEGRLLDRFDHVLVTSPIDREALLELAKNGTKPAPISVLPNGVDQEYFHPNYEIERDFETLVFSGKMSYHANVSMAKYLVDEIMPRIWKTRPTVRLYIVGKDPPSEIKEMEKNPLIKVTGTTDDIRPFLWRATISVVPLLYGAGIQNKILEAMATGTPVVTTVRAISAIPVQAGKHLLAANGPEEFSQFVLRLIGDRNLQNEIADSAAAYVRINHNWTSIATRLVNVYLQTLNLN
jgi:glycosyltransferase involved in cell wall biosynthesis